MGQKINPIGFRLSVNRKGLEVVREHQEFPRHARRGHPVREYLKKKLSLPRWAAW